MELTAEIEEQGSGGDVGRSSATGLHVTPEVLSMNSEVQGAGSREGCTNTTGLQDFPLVGHGGVLGSPATHRRGRQRGQAKAAVAPAGLAGNRYAILVEAREDDKLAGDARDEDCAVLENPGVAELIPQAEEAPAAPQGAYSQEHSGEGAPAALQKATPQQSPGAAERTLQAGRPLQQRQNSRRLEQASQESGSRGGCCARCRRG